MMGLNQYNYTTKYICPNLENQNTHEIAISDTEDINPLAKLSTIRNKNKRGLIVAHLNINSIRSKKEDLKTLITKNVDILAVFETKLDESFPTSQFLIDGFKNPFRYDRNSNGGGILVYIREKSSSE